MLRVENVSKSFAGQTVLSNVSLTLPENGILRLDGPSGSGKTTLIGIMAGIVRPDSGRLIGFDGARCAFAFQDDRLLAWFIALENVALVCDEKKARDMLGALGLGDAVNKRPGELSGGMRKRVNLARALCAPADYLLLDEPLQGLDRALRAEVILPLVRERARSVPTVLVTHNVFDEEVPFYTENTVDMAAINGYSSAIISNNDK